jgi:acyl carrier protein
MNPRLRAVIARAFDLKPDAVPGNASPETVAEWDSVGHINLVSEVEAEFGVRLATEEILAIKGVADLERLLAAKGVAGFAATTAAAKG